MYCVKCGTQIPDDSHFCVNCGHSFIENAPAAEEEQVKKLSLISMILGIASVVSQIIQVGDVLSLPAAIAALVLAYIAKGRSGKEKKLHPYGKTGLICGYVGIGIYALSIIAAIIFLVLYFGIFFAAAIVGSGEMYYSV